MLVIRSSVSTRAPTVDRPSRRVPSRRCRQRAYARDHRLADALGARSSSSLSANADGPPPEIEQPKAPGVERRGLRLDETGQQRRARRLGDAIVDRAAQQRQVAGAERRDHRRDRRRLRERRRAVDASPAARRARPPCAVASPDARARCAAPGGTGSDVEARAAIDRANEEDAAEQRRREVVDVTTGERSSATSAAASSCRRWSSGAPSSALVATAPATADAALPP